MLPELRYTLAKGRREWGGRVCAAPEIRVLLPLKNSRFCLPEDPSGLARLRAYGPRIRPFMVQ